MTSTGRPGRGRNFSDRIDEDRKRRRRALARLRRRKALYATQFVGDELPEYAEYARRRLGSFLRAQMLAALVCYVVMIFSHALVAGHDWGYARQAFERAWLVLPILPMAVASWAVWSTRSLWVARVAPLVTVASFEAGIVLNALNWNYGDVMALPLFVIAPFTASPILLRMGDFALAALITAAGPAVLLVLHPAPGWVQANYALSMTVAMAFAAVINAFTLQALRKNYRLEQQLRSHADIDDLTRLPRRRRVIELSRRALTRCDRAHQPLSVLYIDADRFKQINDRFGHDAGDRALRRIAAQIQDNVRPIDVAGRFGGEEFIVILPAIDRHGAQRIAERLRRQVEDIRDFAVPLTISIGVAQHRPGDGLERVIAAADAALLDAKGAGRNCVVVASAPQECAPSPNLH